MLIIALVLAVIGLAALVTAVVTSNELIAWVCIGASVIGVLLLIVDALRERSRGAKASDDEDTVVAADANATETTETFDAVEAPVDYPDDLVAEPESDVAVESDAAEVDVEADDSAEKYNKN